MSVVVLFCRYPPCILLLLLCYLCNLAVAGPQADYIFLSVRYDSYVAFSPSIRFVGGHIAVERLYEVCWQSE